MSQQNRTAGKSVRLYITCVKSEGKFLKFWAVPEGSRKVLEDIERFLEEKSSSFETSSSFLRSAQLPLGSYFCVKSEIRGRWCRARVEHNSSPYNVTVSLIDYGSKETVLISNVRVADERLFVEHPPLAVECILGDVSPMGNGEWSQDAIVLCENHMLNQTMSGYVISDVNKTPVVRLAKLGESEPFVQRLINKGLANIEPPPRSGSFPKATYSGVPYRSVPLDPKAPHMVKISYVDSPEKFFVQLSAASVELNNLMDAIDKWVSREHLAALESPLMNTPCLSPFSQGGGGKQYFRTLIVDAGSRACKVFLVDYGYTETKDYSELKVIPSHFLTLPVQAIRCALPGGMNVTKDALISATSGKDLYCHILNFNAGTYVVKLSFNNNDLFAPSDPGFSFYNIMHLDIHSKQEVILTYVCTSFEFFCQLARNDVFVQNIQAKLNSESALNPVKLGDCIPGAPVCVKFSEDGAWYRAKVLQTENSDCIKVTFVDYGNSETTSLNNIRRLAPDLVKVPMQALRCTLYGMENTTDLGNSGSTFFEELTEEKKLMVEILSSSRDTGYVVNLYDMANPNVSINFKMKQHILGIQNLVSKVKPLVPEEVQVSRPKPQQFATEVSISAPSIDKTENLYISSFTSPDLFFGQLSKFDESRLDQMQSEINELYSAAGSSNFTPCVGDIVCAKFSDDDSFYRARVEECGVGSACKVFFIDYGNRETVDLSDIHKIRPSFMSLPQFGVECALQSCPTSISVEKLNDLMVDNIFRVNMLSEQNGKWIVTFAEDFVSNAPVLEFLRQHETPTNNVNQDSKKSEDSEADGWNSSDMNERRQYRGDGSGRRDSSRSYTNSDRQNRQDFSADRQRNFSSRSFGDNADGASRNFGERTSGPTRNYSDNVGGGGSRNFGERTGGPTRNYSDNTDGGASRNFGERASGPARNYGDKVDGGMSRNFGERTSGPARNFGDRTGGPSRNFGDRTSVSSRNFGERTNFSKKNFADSTSHQRRSFENSSNWNDNAPHNFGSKNTSSDTSSTEDAPLQMSQNSTQQSVEASKLTGYSHVIIANGTYREVYVSHIVNPGEFYCQVTEEKSKLPAMMEKICHKYVGMNDNEERLDNVSVGLPCCAVYSADGCWYRGKIVGVDFPTRPSACDVFFVDYGNVERVPKLKVKRLDPEFFSFPPQALKCALFNILPQGGSWKQEDIKTFMDMALDKCFVAKFEQVDTDGTHLVNLLNINKLQDDIINKDLTTSGHGRLADANKLLVINSQVASTNLTFPDPDVRDGATEEVTITWVVNPVEFYCQLQSSSSVFIKMMQDLQAYYGKTNDTDHAIDRPQPGMICVAQFSEDCAWYRAKVVRVEKNLVDVYYVDYGNSEQVGKKKVKYIHQDFTIHPVQGIRCLLEGVKLSSESSISRSAGEKYFGGKTTCTFVRNEDGIFYVTLLNDSKNVAKELLQNELVLPGSQLSALSAPIVDVPAVRHAVSCCIPEKQLDTSPGTLLSVSVPFIESPRQFWCNLLDNADELVDLMDLLDDYYNSPDTRPLADINIDRGCVAKYSEDERWYRAVMRNTSTDGYEVFFVDYGNMDTVKSCDVKMIEPEFCTLPAQAIECRLHGLPDLISSEATMEFMKVLDSEELLAKIECVDNGVLVVTLLDSSGDDEVNIGESIFGPIPEKQGLETKVPGFSKSTIHIGVQNGYVSYVNDPSDFYVQLEEIEAELSDFAAELTETYDSVAETDFIVQSACVGMACCAKFTDDNQWYRAEVIDIADSSATVLFIDYGNTDVVQTHSLKLLTDYYLKKPPFAIHCKLAGVKPLLGDSWSAETITVFEQTSLDALFTIKFESQELPSPVVLIKDEENVAKMLADLQLCHYSEPQNANSVHSDVNNICHLATGAQVDIAEEFKLKKYAERICDVKATVKLSCVYSLNKFFVTPLDLLDELESVTDKLQELYNAESDVTFSVDVAKPCAARYSEDMAWYRALVTDINNDDVTVLFVDFGNSEVTGVSSLKHMTHELLKIPPIAVECSLFGVKALPEMQDEITAKFEDFIESEVEFGMEIVESHPTRKIKLKGERDLAEQLVEEGLAEFEHPVSEIVDNAQSEEDLEVPSKGGGDLAEHLVDEGLAECVCLVSEVVDNGQSEENLEVSSMPPSVIENDQGPIKISVQNVSIGKMSASVKCVEISSNLIVLHVVPSHLEDALTELQDRLEASYGQSEKHDPCSSSTYCAAKSSRDNCWYRAQILQANEGSYYVKYVDYGNCETVVLDSVTELLPEYLDEHQYSISCCMFGITVVDGKEGATESRIYDLTGGKHIVLKICCDVSGPFGMCWGLSSVDGLNIIQTLAEEGLVCHLYPPVQLPGEVFEAKVDSIETDNDLLFHVIPTSWNAERDALLNDLQEVYEESEEPSSAEISPNLLYAVQFHDEWHRGYVLSSSVEQVVIYFIDFGYTKVLSPSCLRPLSSDFCQKAPLILRCVLHDWEHPVSETIGEKFYELCMAKTAVCKVYDFSLAFEPFSVSLAIDGSDILSCIIQFVSDSLKASEEENSFLETGTTCLPESCVEPKKENVEDLQETNAAHLPHSFKPIDDDENVENLQETNAADLPHSFKPIDDDENVEDLQEANAAHLPHIFKPIDDDENVEDLQETDAAHLPHSSFEPIEEDENVEDLQEMKGEYFARDSLDVPVCENFGEDANNLDYPNSRDMFGVENFDDICAQIGFSAAVEDLNKQHLPATALAENVEKDTGMQKYPERPVSNTCTIKLSYVYSSDKFYVTPVDLQEQLNYITSTLKEEYDLPCESDEQPLCAAEIMQPCVAQYWEDMTWYRALIMGVEDNEISVVFVDFGNTEIVERGSLRMVTPELLKIPPLAIECSLFGIQAVPGKQEEIDSRLMFLLKSGVELEMEVIEHHEPYKVKLKGDVDISEQLIADGLCYHYVPPSQKLQDSETFKENLRIAFLEEPLSLEDNKGFIPHQNISPGEMFVTVKYVELSNDIIVFHVVPDNLEAALADFQERLKVIYGNSCGSDLQLESKFCAAKSSEDELWYRAQILEKRGECYHVKFIDYGNCEIIPSCDVRELLPEFLVDNQYSVSCYLSGVKVTTGKEEAVEAKIYDLTCQKKTSVEIFDLGSSTTGMCRATLKAGSDDITHILFQDGLVFQVYPHPYPPSAVFEAQIEGIRSGDQLMFYVIPKEWIQARHVFQEELHEVCDSSEPFPPSAISCNCLCAAMLDEQWCRASVISVDEDSVVVNFIDFGNCKLIDKGSLRGLESKFCHKSPFVLQCLFYGFSFPVTDTVCDALTEICTGKIVTCKVQQPFHDSEPFTVSIGVDDAVSIVPCLVELENKISLTSETDAPYISESSMISRETAETSNKFSGGDIYIDERSTIYEYDPHCYDKKIPEELDNYENSSSVQSGNVEIDAFDNIQQEDGDLQCHSSATSDFGDFTKEDDDDVVHCETSNVDHFGNVEVEDPVPINNLEVDQFCAVPGKVDFSRSLPDSDLEEGPHPNESESYSSGGSLLVEHPSVPEEFATSICDSSSLALTQTKGGVEKCIDDIPIAEEAILAEGSLPYSSSFTESISSDTGCADDTLGIPKSVDLQISSANDSGQFALGDVGFSSTIPVERLAQDSFVFQTADPSEAERKNRTSSSLSTGSLSCLEESSQSESVKTDSSALQITDAEDSEGTELNEDKVVTVVPSSISHESAQSFPDSPRTINVTLCGDRCVSKEQETSITDSAALLNNCESDADSPVLPSGSSNPSYSDAENVSDVNNCENIDRICTEVKIPVPTSLCITTDSVSKENE